MVKYMSTIVVGNSCLLMIMYICTYIIRLIEEALDKISTIKQQEAGEKSRASRQQTQPPLSIEDIQTRCVCVCVCLSVCCLCALAHVCIHTRFYVHVYVYVFVYVRLCACVCVHACVFVGAYLCVCMCACLRACVCACLGVCMYVCVCTRACVHVCVIKSTVEHFHIKLTSDKQKQSY